MKSLIIIFSFGLGEWARREKRRGWAVWGGENVDKQSDQRQSLRKKGVQSEGKEGEKRRGEAERGVG